MSKKRILFVDHDPHITGSTISLRYLIDGFYKNGFEVILLTPKNGHVLDYFKEYNLNIVHWKYKVDLPLYSTNTTRINSIRGIKSLVRLLLNLLKGFVLSYIYLKKIKPDLIYINEYVLSQFSVAGKLLNIPVVTHIRSPFLKGSFGIRRYLLSNLLKIFNNYVFAISEQEAGQILENITDTKNNIKIVREFLDEKDFFTGYDITNLKKSFSIPPDRKVILMVGGIEPIKGSYELIVAFSKIITKYKDLQLIIAGPINNNPVYNKKCFDFIDSNKLNENITIMDFTANIHHLIACCDILISSSSISHFSRPVIEAWAQKKAVISSNTIHSIEYIADNVDGLLYVVGKSDSLAEKISLLLLDEEKYLALCEAGYLKAQREFTAEKNLNKILDYCRSLI